MAAVGVPSQTSSPWILSWSTRSGTTTGYVVIATCRTGIHCQFAVDRTRGTKTALVGVSRTWGARGALVYWIIRGRCYTVSVSVETDSLCPCRFDADTVCHRIQWLPVSVIVTDVSRGSQLVKKEIG